jgi:phosphate/sulfate permease
MRTMMRWTVVRWLMVFPMALAGSLIGLVAMMLTHTLAIGFVPDEQIISHKLTTILPFWLEIPIMGAGFAVAAALFVLFGTFTTPSAARERAPFVLFLFGAFLAPIVLPGMDSKRGLAYAIACYGSGFLTALFLRIHAWRKSRLAEVVHDNAT